MPDEPDPTIAYLLKGYPRLSELFIASEIERLERTGLRLRLFVIKPPDEPPRHRVVERIRARPEYLPPVTTVSGTACAPVAGAQPAPVPRPAGAHGAAAAARSGPSAAGGRRAGGAGSRGALRLAAQGLHEGVPAGRRAGRPPARRPERAPPARALRSRLDDGRVARLDRSPGVGFSFTGHAKDVYSDSLNPAGLLGRKLRAATLRGHLHGRGARAPAAGRPGDAGALRLSRPQRRPRPARWRSAAAPLGQRLAAACSASGGWCPKKGFDMLVEASSLLADRGVEVEATLAGEDGEHSEEIRRLIAARGVGRRFELAGPLDQSELHRAYLGADVFCLPCRILADGDRDGIPNVLVEAMACGLPVVTTPVSGIPELVRAEDNGLLVPPDDPEAVAEALLRLRTDPELAARLGRARARVRAASASTATASRAGWPPCSRRRSRDPGRGDHFDPAPGRLLPPRPRPPRSRRRRGGMRRPVHLRRDDPRARAAARLAGRRAARGRGVADRVDEVLLRPRPRLRLFDRGRAALPAGLGAPGDELGQRRAGRRRHRRRRGPPGLRTGSTPGAASARRRASLG